MILSFRTVRLRTDGPTGRGRAPRAAVRRAGRAGSALLCALVCFWRPAPAAAQTLPELTATPEGAAELFIRSVRTLRWSAAAQFVDPETLAYFRDVVTMITEVEPSGTLLRDLTGADTAGYRRLQPPEVFARAMDVLTGEMVGLAHSLADRDDRILGHVPEGADSAHVVYRTQMRISGSVPEVVLMQMRRGPGGWRVLWSDELDVLEAALRGAAHLRRPGPGGRGEPVAAAPPRLRITPYSARNVSSGSVRPARYAGSHDAATAVRDSTTAAEVSVRGSVAEIP